MEQQSRLKFKLNRHFEEMNRMEIRRVKRGVAILKRITIVVSAVAAGFLRRSNRIDPRRNKHARKPPIHLLRDFLSLSNR